MGVDGKVYEHVQNKPPAIAHDVWFVWLQQQVWKSNG